MPIDGFHERLKLAMEEFGADSDTAQRMSANRLQALLAARRVDGSSRTTFFKYLSGEGTPPADFAVACADILKVRLDWLLRGQAPMRAHAVPDLQTARFKRDRSSIGEVLDAVRHYTEQALDQYVPGWKLSQHHERVLNAVEPVVFASLMLDRWGRINEGHYTDDYWHWMLSARQDAIRQTVDDVVRSIYSLPEQLGFKLPRTMIRWYTTAVCPVLVELGDLALKEESEAAEQRQDTQDEFERLRRELNRMRDSGEASEEEMAEVEDQLHAMLDRYRQQGGQDV